MFGAGAVYALWIAVVSWAWGEFAAAGVGGLAAVLLLTRGQHIFRKSNSVAAENALVTATSKDGKVRFTTVIAIVRGLMTFDQGVQSQ